MTARILVVDDESVTRRIVTHTLKAIDVEAVSAINAVQALDLAAQELFQMALVDINLPDLDGFELVARLKALPHNRDMPIIIFTARNDSGDQTRALEVGALSFFYKPFSTQELRELVTQYVTHY